MGYPDAVMKRLIPFLITALVVLSPLSAKGDQDAVSGSSTGVVPTETAREQAELTITDALGREVTLPAAPQRIVQAGAFTFMINDALYLFPSASEKLVAMVNGSQGRGQFLEAVDPDYGDKKLINRSVNIEEILAVNPDLVVMKNFHIKKYGELFDEMNIPVVYLDLETPEAWEKDLKTLGQIYGNPERQQELSSSLKSYRGKVEEAMTGLKVEERKDVLILYYSEKDGAGAFNLPPLGFIQTTMAEMAGGNPVWKDAEMGSRWTKVGFEQIAAWDPDQIFLISYSTPMDKVLGMMEERPEWRELRAWKEGEVHPFPMDFHSWDQPDIRWLLGLQWMASIIQPERFSFEGEPEAREFFNTFYDIDKQRFDKFIAPVLEGLD